MIYRGFKDKDISLLGMGCMRLPTIDGDDKKPDEQKTAEMVEYAMKSGVNYYDTAWGYHGGNSELVMGRILKNYERNSFYLATKFPGFDKESFLKVPEIFEKQLEKLQTEYIDFYLFHNICETNIDEYLAHKDNLISYFAEEKKKGRINHIGFSCHSSFDTMVRFLEAYGELIEFCQLQLNYIDWDFQDAKSKVLELNKRNIPIVVMEPLRGGKLANVPEDVLATVRESRAGITAPQLALRYVESLPGIFTVLSGMSNYEQLVDNINTFSQPAPFSDDELKLVYKVSEYFMNGNVPCTSCRYCTKYCPQELDIPRLLGLYNEDKVTNGGFVSAMNMNTIPKEKRPSACVGCKSCEVVCPQQIEIAQVMSDYTESLKKNHFYHE